MKVFTTNLAKYFLFVAVIVQLLGLCGCAHEDSANVSARPWNTPKSWEHGLPTGMFEGR